MEIFCMPHPVMLLIFMVSVFPLHGSQYGTVTPSNNSTSSLPFGHSGFCPNSLRSPASCIPPPPCVPCADALCSSSQKCCQVQGCCSVCAEALSTPPPTQRPGTYVPSLPVLAVV